MAWLYSSLIGRPWISHDVSGSPCPHLSNGVTRNKSKNKHLYMGL